MGPVPHNIPLTIEHVLYNEYDNIEHSESE